ncbi:hypothetical protein B0H16DRAFT_1312732 [Mycena metata]|uniref:Uncharacterized protein n=1 Tax=Mycena metata TaxID=1033252 RepID=A0AAD7JAF7_9AGAR|nr:hypothetical protein B0H16DRAFT_1312732 [Mycena metata]
MKAHLIGHIVLPATAENPPQGTSAVMRKVYLAFHLFYLEWDCFMGPDPTAPLPPATPDFPNYEAMAFVSLFPYGVGHYVGPEKQNGLTFDRYALNRLKLADPRFRQSAEWLTWALTRTADPELAKAINCMLVTLHKQKAWHLGKGQVQVLSLNDMFV